MRARNHERRALMADGDKLSAATKGVEAPIIEDAWCVPELNPRPWPSFNAERPSAAPTDDDVWASARRLGGSQGVRSVYGALFALRMKPDLLPRLAPLVDAGAGLVVELSRLQTEQQLKDLAHRIADHVNGLAPGSAFLMPAGLVVPNAEACRPLAILFSRNAAGDLAVYVVESNPMAWVPDKDRRPVVTNLTALRRLVMGLFARGAIETTEGLSVEDIRTLDAGDCVQILRQHGLDPKSCELRTFVHGFTVKRIRKAAVESLLMQCYVEGPPGDESVVRRLPGFAAALRSLVAGGAPIDIPDGVACSKWMLDLKHLTQTLVRLVEGMNGARDFKKAVLEAGVVGAPVAAVGRTEAFVRGVPLRATLRAAADRAAAIYADAIAPLNKNGIWTRDERRRADSALKRKLKAEAELRQVLGSGGPELAKYSEAVWQKQNQTMRALKLALKRSGWGYQRETVRGPLQAGRRQTALIEGLIAEDAARTSHVGGKKKQGGKRRGGKGRTPRSPPVRDVRETMAAEGAVASAHEAAEMLEGLVAARASAAPKKAVAPAGARGSGTRLPYMALEAILASPEAHCSFEVGGRAWNRSPGESRSKVVSWFSEDAPGYHFSISPRDREIAIATKDGPTMKAPEFHITFDTGGKLTFDAASGCPVDPTSPAHLNDEYELREGERKRALKDVKIPAKSFASALQGMWKNTL